MEVAKTHCLVCKKPTSDDGPGVDVVTAKGRPMHKSKCAECGKNKSRFLKKAVIDIK